MKTMLLLSSPSLQFSHFIPDPKLPNPYRNSIPRRLRPQALNPKLFVDLVPPLYLDELPLLQDRTSSFSTEVAIETIEKECGLPLDKKFSEISPAPVTAASVGQNCIAEPIRKLLKFGDDVHMTKSLLWACMFSFGQFSVFIPTQVAHADDSIKADAVYDIAEIFELGIQLSYLLLLLALIGAGTFFVIRQVLVRRELDLSAKELQEQVRSGDASATEYFELGAVMLRRKFYPAAIKYFLQAIQKWDGDDQDLSQVYNALGVSYVRDGKLDKAITQFETSVKLQPGYVTAWNNLGDAYEKKKDYKSALKAFEEALLFDPNNKVAQPRRDSLKDRIQMYKGVPIKSKNNG